MSGLFYAQKRVGEWMSIIEAKSSPVRESHNHLMYI
jgi:hypothetical protein